MPEPMDGERTTERVTVSFDADVHARLKDIAAANAVSISWVVRHAVDRLLEDLTAKGDQQLLLPLRRPATTGGQ